jgi:hypothetical protein
MTSNRWEIQPSAHTKEKRVIEYKVVDTLKVHRRFWINLTTAGQWVARKHLKPDDVRITVTHAEEVFTTSALPTAAEKLTLLLMGKPYEECEG